jgi:hypothetical protein
MHRGGLAVDAQDGLYAYGLVDTLPHSLAVPGIDQHHPIYAVRARDMCLLVSKIDVPAFQRQVGDLFAALHRAEESARSGVESILRLHEAVVDLLRQQTTVVPFKFGTILKDEQAARQLLHDCAEQFTKLLAKFTGKAEWGLKVYADRQTLTRYLASPAQAGHDPADGQVQSRGLAYLHRKKREAQTQELVSAQLAAISEAIWQQMGAYAEEACIHETLPRTLTGHEMILNAAYLLADTHSAHFCQQGEVLKETYQALGLDLEISGPWSAYSFTETWDD